MEYVRILLEEPQPPVEEVELLLQPVLSFVVLTLGTVPVATRMILVLDLIARLTGIDVSTQGKGAAAFNSPHRLSVTGQHPVPILGPILRSVAAEDVGHLYHARSPIT